MPHDRRHDGLSEPLGDPLIAAIEDALTLATYSFARPRRHDALLRTHAVPASWAAWRAQPALYALLDRIARSRTARPSHLASALGLSRSTVSHELRRLEERQLIYRNDFAVPRWRGKAKPIFAPTVQGYNALRQLRGVRRTAVVAATRDWSDRDKIELARLLKRLSADCAPPSPPGKPQGGLPRSPSRIVASRHTAPCPKTAGHADPDDGDLKDAIDQSQATSRPARSGDITGPRSPPARA
jgi:DNA-binding MarR family transcriptional regulator